MNCRTDRERGLRGGMKGAVRWVMGGMSIAAAMAAMLVLTPPGAAQATKPDPEKEAIAKAKADTATKDVLIFNNGQIVEGKILSETPTTIKMLVKLGNLSAPTEYPKADILEIKRDVPTGDAPAKDADKPADDETKDDAAAQPGDAPVKIYVVEMKGEAFRDVTPTPMRQIIRDIIKEQPDYIVYKFNFDFKSQMDAVRGAPEEFGDVFNIHSELLEKARELDSLINDEVTINYPLAKKPVVIAWIQKAMGSAAFLPLSFPIKNTYYTTDGQHGGLGYMDMMFVGRSGDEVVKRKQESLRLGRAKGLGEKGGYPVEIVLAMTTLLPVVSVDFVGGSPKYYQHGGGEVLLTDSGVGPDGDSLEDIVRGRGNDALTLHAEMAFRLGISQGTVDTIEELATKLNISRNYVVVKDKAERILKQWSEDVGNAEKNIWRLRRELAGIDIQGDYKQRTAARGRMISNLEETKSVLKKYEEAINPWNILAYPPSYISDINVQLELLRTQQRLDERT